MDWKVTTPPAALPLELSTIRTYLRIDDDDTTQDAEITDEISAAVAHAEQSMECSLITRTITATYYDRDRHDSGYTGYGWPIHHHHRLPLPRGPLLAITSVLDANNSTPTYRIEKYGHAEQLVTTSPWMAPLIVVYTAGFGASATNVPNDIRQAMKQHAATMYAYRESISDKAMVPVPHALADFYRLNSRGTVLS